MFRFLKEEIDTQARQQRMQLDMSLWCLCVVKGQSELRSTWTVSFVYSLVRLTADRGCN